MARDYVTGLLPDGAAPTDQQPPACDPSRMQWQPIATAPKDGTWILITGGDVSEAARQQDEYGIRGGPAVVAFWEADGYIDNYGIWSYAFWDGNWRSSFEGPTHWMPLPPTPLPSANEDP